ncbi:metal ABC transporter substrate-binding protein [Eubacteriales bacterium KG127]
MKKRRTLSVIVICLMLAALLVGCGANKAEKTEKKPIVYTSIYPVYDLVHQVAKDTVDLRTFMPTNTDPHLWEPTAKDMKELAKADILFINGANMEKWSDQVAKNLPNLKIINLSDKVTLITYKGAASIGDFQYMAKMHGEANKKYKFEFGHTHEDIMRVTFARNDRNLPEEEFVKKCKQIMSQNGETVGQEKTISVKEGKVYNLEMGHVSGRIHFKFDSPGDWYVVSDRVSERLLPYQIEESNGGKVELEEVVNGSTAKQDKITYDPHSWLSIKNAKSYLNYIYDVLAENYGDNAKFYRKNKFKAVDKLTDIEAHYFEKFKKLKNREFVVTHYAWEYLAREYNLIQYPLEGLVSTESPSLKTIKKAVDFSQKRKINTIFYEDNMPPKEAETISQEIKGGKFVPLNSMEYVKPEEEAEGSYTKFMEENLEKIYESLKEGER